MDSTRNSSYTQNFPIVAIVFGFMLVIAAGMSGMTITVALYKGMTALSTLSDIRAEMVRIVFDFITPLAGGITLVIAGLMIIRSDAHALQRHITSMDRKKLVK